MDANAMLSHHAVTVVCTRVCVGDWYDSGHFTDLRCEAEVDGDGRVVRDRRLLGYRCKVCVIAPKSEVERGSRDLDMYEK